MILIVPIERMKLTSFLSFLALFDLIRSSLLGIEFGLKRSRTFLPTQSFFFFLRVFEEVRISFTHPP